MKEELTKRINYILDKYSDENDIMFHLRNLVYENEIKTGITRETKTISSLFSESMDALQNKKPFCKIFSTGFASLDNEIGGFYEGEYIVIGSRPSMGKTQFLINLAIQMSKQHKVLFYSFDLTNFLLSNRIISTLSGVPFDKILQQKLTEEEVTKIAIVEKEISCLKIYMNDSFDSSVSAFRNECLKQINENGVTIIIIDYLQLMSSYRYRNHRELEISYISRELKKIAKENNVCVIVSSQLSRATELRSGTKRPQLSDLRESGAIEQDADKVIFLHRPERYGLIEDEEGNSLINIVELITAKNRNGRLGDISLVKDDEFTILKDFEGIVNTFEFSAERLKDFDNNAPF